MLTYMQRAKPITSGTWAKVGKKHYRHVSGVEVRYDWKRWGWEVIGGADDGNAYTTLNVAQHAGTRTGGQ